MKKFLSISLVLFMVVGLVTLTGCVKKDETEENVVENIAVEENVQKVVDRTNSKLKTDEEVKDQIEKVLPEYFEMLYGDKVLDVRCGDITIFKGDEEAVKVVDLAENDYAFTIDFEIKPKDEKDVEELTQYVGEYDEEKGWISAKGAYGVMRYNNIDDDFDITSITADSF